jgi:subtilase family serine protease
VTVRNDGHHDYRGARFELHVDQREERGSRQMIDLKAGESRRVVTQWTPDRAGDHEVNLSIDAYIEPYEVDYANNARRATVKVR